MTTLREIDRIQDTFGHSHSTPSLAFPSAFAQPDLTSGLFICKGPINRYLYERHSGSAEGRHASQATAGPAYSAISRFVSAISRNAFLQSVWAWTARFKGVEPI